MTIYQSLKRGALGLAAAGLLFTTGCVTTTPYNDLVGTTKVNYQQSSVPLDVKVTKTADKLLSADLANKLNDQAKLDVPGSGEGYMIVNIPPGSYEDQPNQKIGVNMLRKVDYGDNQRTGLGSAPEEIAFYTSVINRMLSGNDFGTGAKPVTQISQMYFNDVNSTGGIDSVTLIGFGQNAPKGLNVATCLTKGYSGIIEKDSYTTIFEVTDKLDESQFKAKLKDYRMIANFIIGAAISAGTSMIQPTEMTTIYKRDDLVTAGVIGYSVDTVTGRLLTMLLGGKDPQNARLETALRAGNYAGLTPAQAFWRAMDTGAMLYDAKGHYIGTRRAGVTPVTNVVPIGTIHEGDLSGLEALLIIKSDRPAHVVKGKPMAGYLKDGDYIKGFSITTPPVRGDNALIVSGIRAVSSAAGAAARAAYLEGKANIPTQYVYIFVTGSGVIQLPGGTGGNGTPGATVPNISPVPNDPIGGDTPPVNPF